MKLNENLVLERCGLQVLIEARRAGGDQGVTFRVYGVDEKRNKVELLRFDCFKKNPHYHYAPMGKNEEHRFARGETPDPLEWVLAQLKSQLPKMIEHAGYAAIARATDQTLVADGLAKLETDIHELQALAMKG